MAEDDDDDELRWRFSRRMFSFLIPGYFSYARRKGRKQDGLETLRQLWFSFATSGVLYGVVIAFMELRSAKKSATPWVVALSIATALCLVVEGAFGRRSLDCRDLGKLLASYRTRFFARTASAQAIALFAFAATMVVAQKWIYWLFLPFSLLGSVRNAPTGRHLRQDQENLRAAGCQLSIVEMLRGSS